MSTTDLKHDDDDGGDDDDDDNDDYDDDEDAFITNHITVWLRH